MFRDNEIYIRLSTNQTFMRKIILNKVFKPWPFRMAFLVFTFCFLFSCNKKETGPSRPECRHDEGTTLTVAEAAMVSEAKAKLITFMKEHRMVPVMERGSGNTHAPGSGTKRSLESGSENLSYTIADISYNHALIKRGINPEDYQCDPTIIDDYVNNSIQTWNDDDFFFFNAFGNVVFDYAYVYANSNGGQFYGTKGQFTSAVNRTFKDLLRFWNIPTDILLRDAHGDLFKDATKTANVILIEYPFLTEADAAYYADLCKTVFGSSHFNSYKHPLLTFNAFAAPADDYFHTVKKIVMGDGIMQAYDDMGFGDVAPQAILAHEYGHQVQFAKNVDFGSGAEGTMRTELMADAFSAYFLTHKQGAAMNWKRVQEFFQVFYAIGDCAFDNDGHHGTPNQRMKAAQFGYGVASDTKKKGKVLTAEDFITLFDAAYADLTAPDA
jgi:hypothetical protein